jgi:hypothetical protein
VRRFDGRRVVQASYLASLDQRLMSTHQRFALTISLKNLFAPTFFCHPSFAKPTAHRLGRRWLRVKRFPRFAVMVDCFARFSAIPPGCLRISANIRDGSLSEDQIIPKMIAVNGSLSRKGNLPDGLRSNVTVNWLQ